MMEKRKINPLYIGAGVILIVVVAGILIWQAIPKTLTATIRIDSNTSWNGSIGFGVQSRTEAGYGNKEFSCQFTGPGKVIVVAVIQKQGEGGILQVSIVVNGKVMATQTTTAPYGVVSVSWATDL